MSEQFDPAAVVKALEGHGVALRAMALPDGTLTLSHWVDVVGGQARAIFNDAVDTPEKRAALLAYLDKIGRVDAS